jgi:hypothetical protein
MNRGLRRHWHTPTLRIMVVGALGTVGLAVAPSSAPAGRDLDQRHLGSGGHVLAFQSDGNLVIWAGGTPVWSTGTTGRGATALVMQDDGNLVLWGLSGALSSSELG